MGNNSGSPERNNAGKAIGIIAVIVALIIVIFNSAYQIKEQEQAVLITWGKAQPVTEPGLHFKIPFVQKVKKVNTTIQGFAIGYDSETGAPLENDSLMITSDYNFVNVDFFVEYRITDPIKYLYSSNAPELILRNLIQSQVRNVVGSSAVDDVLTNGKENIQQQVRELVTGILEEYDIGLTLVDVRIQDAEPPTQAVNEAFKAVETAKQKKETVINEANAYKNAQIPQAEATVNQLEQNAEVKKQQRINEAKEQVAMFKAMFEEYQRNPEVTKSRMYYEVISRVFPGVKIVINTGSDSVDMMLPLDSLVTAGGN
jgi:membrane protease subunit HflK